MKNSNRMESLTGFTLIELLIVLVIIGIALGFVSITLYHEGGALELNTFVKDVSATLRYARSHAIAEKKIYSFIMLRDKRAYGLYVDFPSNSEEKPEPIIYKTIPEFFETIFKSSTDDLKIDFFPQGNSSGGIVEVRNQKGKSFLITVNKITGRVEVK